MEVSFEVTQKQEASHTLGNIDCRFPDKLNRNQCYKRSSEGREKIEQELKTSRSKLPRIVKTNLTSYGNRCFKQSENRINDSDDVRPGSSGLQTSPGCEGEKYKPSQIPRRRSNREAPIKNSVMPKKFISKPPFKTQARNVQRIQVLNTLQDFYTEKRPTTTSIATSRPIPTLGQIYRTTDDTNRVTDWLLERDNSYLHAPVSSLVAELDHISEANTTGDATQNDGTTDHVINQKSSEKPVSEHHEQPKSNTKHWMSIHEYPTRDNESGYCSMSAGPRVPKYMNSKHSDSIPIVKQSENRHYLNISETKSSDQSTSSTNGNSAGTLISEKQTVLLAEKAQGSDQTLLAAKILSRHKSGMQNSQSGFTKGMQFPSDGTFAKSYVDCPSEVFQKTTDFETAGYASSSSIAATDLEYREYSSRGTLENIDGISMIEEDTHQWSSTGTKSLNSFSCDLLDEQAAMVRQSDELSTKCNTGFISTGTYRHYSNCCILRRDRCKRLHGRSFFAKHYSNKEGLMTTSSNKFKGRRQLEMPRKRLSFRRMCQRRWNSVCQKTAERFANRPKSSVKVMRIKMMYAHPELFLEDVNVQTSGALCRDTAMGTITREQRSAGIATSFKWGSPHLHFMDAATSGTLPANKKPLPRYADFGPSMFPWQFSTNSKRKYATPQNSENMSNMSNMSKKRRQSKSTPNYIYRPTESRNTRSIKSLQEPNNFLKDESSAALIIKDSTPSVSKEIEADQPTSPLHQVESKTTIIISCPYSIKRMKEDQAIVPDEIRSKETIFSSIKDSEVAKSGTIAEHKRSFEGPVYGSSENVQIKNQEPSYQNVILTGAGTNDFLHGKNDELIKSLQYSDLIYLEQPYTNNMIACNPAEVKVSFCAPSKCCQTGTSCRMHYLYDRSTSVETQSFIEPAVTKTSKGMVTSAADPQNVSIGLSGFQFNHLEKKEAATETLPPLIRLGYQGPKIMSISSDFMTSPSADAVRRETRNTGNSAKPIVLKDIQILTSPSLRYRPSRLVSCGTDMINDVEGHSKATSVEKIVFYSDTGTNAVQVKSKKSFNSGSGSLEIPKLNANHYLPASIITDTSKSISLGVSNNISSKSSSLAVFKKSSRHTAQIDVCVQHNNIKEQPIKSYRSAAIVCNKMPSFCKAETGTSTTELTGQDQEIDTSEEMTPSIGDYDNGTPKSGASSKLNANKWIKKCIASMEKEQITTILGQRVKSSKTREEKVNTRSASEFTLNSSKKDSSLDVSPFSGTGKKPDVPVAAMTCITCLKPQTSSPLLSTDASEELMSKLMTEERTRSLLLRPTPYAAVLNASDVLRKRELKGTPAQTALSGLQKAEIQLCGEKKTENVFTSCYQLTSPAPGQRGCCQPHSSVLAPVSAVTTTSHSVAVATDPVPAPQTPLPLQPPQPPQPLQTPQNKKHPGMLPQLPEITEKSVMKTVHSATVSVAHLAPALHTREQNTEVTDVVVPRVPAATSAKRFPHNVTFSAAAVPNRLSREQNTELTEEFVSQVLEATTTKRSTLHSVAVSTADHTSAGLTQEQNTERTEEFLSQGHDHEATAARSTVHAVAVSTADHAPTPVRVTREQNTELTEEFLSQVLAATKKHAPHSVTFSTADPRQARLTEEFLSQDCIELLVCDPLAEDATQTFAGNYPPVIWFSRNKPVHIHDCNLLTSCRYYSKLLSEQINRVKENLTKHLTPPNEKLNDHETQAELQSFKEACTMKPSGRNEFACQTQVRRVPNIRQIKAMSCCALNHAFSVTDICRGHENDLRTVYYLLSAIEGRIRRMKRHL